MLELLLKHFNNKQANIIITEDKIILELANNNSLVLKLTAVEEIFTNS